MSISYVGLLISWCCGRKTSLPSLFIKVFSPGLQSFGQCRVFDVTLVVSVFVCACVDFAAISVCCKR